MLGPLEVIDPRLKIKNQRGGGVCDWHLLIGLINVVLCPYFFVQFHQIIFPFEMLCRYLVLTLLCAYLSGNGVAVLQWLGMPLVKSRIIIPHQVDLVISPSAYFLCFRLQRHSASFILNTLAGLSYKYRGCSVVIIVLCFLPPALFFFFLFYIIGREDLAHWRFGKLDEKEPHFPNERFSLARQLFWPKKREL